ncbi:peptidoglycan-binding domain-containing protein [Streptomyces sp. ActVer]|uniref:peptidoglycan-binding domain-containing protein n=1 Tax=Streptomyces sp. ActVer TaxID=3014558 RepID=UPI0022B4988B|nr:peptidoglycan-binding domain-containing protein [Streptomyces sp. ActVer]MCZ4511621.1 peptidoglycan-binding domain-containing protein [Streptomyces sp. ActVer]
MRPNVLTRALVSVTTVVGIAAGSLAAAGTSFAASEPATKPAAISEAVAPLAVNNLGLSTAQAKKVQGDLKAHWGYDGDIDGLLGTNSWKAMQRGLKEYWGYDDAIDGIVGPNTVKALQRWLKSKFGYNGDIDGIAGPGTQAAFKRAADSL